MSALSAHRTLGGRLRSELYRNVCLLSLRRPMLQDLCLMLNGGPQTLDKLNQALLIHLSYYLASVIEPKLSGITWPLYDKASERTYKTQLLSFLSMYYSKMGSTENDRWITPIQPSYLNAGGFKVMQLLFEMSQLALSKLIRTDFKLTPEKMDACNVFNFTKQKEKLNLANAKAKKELVSKSVKFLMLKQRAFKLSEIYKSSIIDLEKENEALKKTLVQCIDNFSKSTQSYMLNDLKDVNKRSMFLKDWTDYGDDKMIHLEDEWSANTLSITSAATECRDLAKLIISRSTLSDKSAYTIEYCPKTDKIDTESLEKEVSSQQRYILKNIIRNDTLNFPNLLRGYAVAICYLFKNVHCVEPMDEFNQHLAGVAESYGQLKTKGKWLLDKMHQLDLKMRMNNIHLSPAQENVEERDEIVIPPLPDLRFRDEPWQNQHTNRFTPLIMSKVQFNIRNYVTPEVLTQPRSLFQVPLTIAKPNLFKSVPKYHADESMISNVSRMAHPLKEINKTTADCLTGFTQQQLNRLLSSRKSSAKKVRPSHNTDSHSKVRRSNLFKDTPENSFTITRSQSSPNLNSVPSDLKKKYIAQNQKIRQLYAIAQEESPDRPMEISGVMNLQSSKNSTPQNTSLSAQHGDFKSMPVITVSNMEVTPKKTPSINDLLLDNNISSNLDAKCKDAEPIAPEPEIATPSITRNVPVEKTKANSIEKLIEKYKKIRRNTSKVDSKLNIFPSLSPITDLQQPEKENDFNAINVDTSFSGKLPDLVSPSFKNIYNPVSSIVSDLVLLETPVPTGKKKCRESLGAALGVDNTFLDQFDLME